MPQSLNTRWKYSYSTEKYIVQICAACDKPFLGVYFTDQIITHSNNVAIWSGVCYDYCKECLKVNGIYAN